MSQKLHMGSCPNQEEKLEQQLPCQLCIKVKTGQEKQELKPKLLKFNNEIHLMQMLNAVIRREIIGKKI